VDFPVTLRTISKSRNAAGEVRPWSLEVDNRQVGIIGSALKATVIATTQIPTSVLQNRIDDLLGPNGNKLAIYGENLKGRVLARLEILDEYSAETMDIHHLLRDVLGKVVQDPLVSTSSVEAHIPYNLANRSDSLGYGLSLDVGSLKVTAIKVSVGASQHIQPSIPAVTIEVDVQGQCVINLGGFELATVSLNNHRITMEAGATADGAGNIVTSSWINDNPISLDISWEAAVLAGILTGGLVVLGLVGLTELIESEVNGPIVDKFRSVIEGAIFQAPSIMAMLLGANFTLTSFRVEAGAIVIDYVAPVEPDPKPSSLYTGVIGRWAMKLGPHLWRFFPRTVGDTWAAGNLAKVDHIVVVMMENRSFDHVLGYRGLLPGAQGENGWSADLINFLTHAQFTIRPLSESEILPNAANLKTRFPYSVGHMLADVTQQLSARLQAPTGSINSPQGFIDSFRKEVGSDTFDLNNVLGYYEASDLAFYAYLAENYTYCEQYFASHPGPTLPNRMYSLAGDVQYDRVGEAVLDNNNGDNLALSRALNIFDVLSRNGVSWRVYESFPSITMLRMFARYAADNTNIVDIAGLEQDIAGFNLPSVTFIDPAMHSAPENDDHPPFADMLTGQIFIKRVYDALRSNEALWAKTLLIVTYDEHGGFYDHVIPPLADALSLPFVLTDGGAPGQPTPAFKADMTISYGLRVPTFVVSPWVPAGKGFDIPLDHCSILKTILARFCGPQKPFLTDRVNSSHTFDSFLTLTKPSLGQVSVPVLPTVSSPRLPANGRQIVTRPLSTRIMQKGSVEFHDLTGALARMLGRH
jgi:phospholipase C